MAAHSRARKDNMKLVESSNSNGWTTLTMDFSDDTYESYKRQLAEIEKMKYGNSIPANVQKIDHIFENMSGRNIHIENALAQIVCSVLVYHRGMKNVPIQMQAKAAHIIERIEKMNMSEDDLYRYFD